MIVDLVRAETRDGLRLDGAFQPAHPSAVRRIDLDAVCFLHGTGGNFYGSTLFEDLGNSLRELGCGVLRANTRGHDLMSLAALKEGGARQQGAAYEMVDECRHDVAAWMEWLRRYVGSRIGLLGHSLGALKALYATAQEPKLNAKCVIAVSPPHLSYAWFCKSGKSDEFLRTFQKADQLIEAGEGGTLMPVRFPLAFVITASGYADKYGPEERFNFSRFIAGVPCPSLVTLGELEVADNVAFQRSPDELMSAAESQPLLAHAIIPGANHFYADRRDRLVSEVRAWLLKTLGTKQTGDDWQI